MEIFVGLEFDDDEAAVAVDGEQVEHAAIACGEGGDLGVDELLLDAGEDFSERGSEGGLHPALRLEAVERIAHVAVGLTAAGETADEIDEEGFAGFVERSFVGSRAEGQLLLAGEGVGAEALAGAGELQSVEEEGYLAGAAGQDLDALMQAGWQQGEQPRDGYGAAFERGLRAEGLRHVHVEVAIVELRRG